MGILILHEFSISNNTLPMGHNIDTRLNELIPTSTFTHTYILLI